MESKLAKLPQPNSNGWTIYGAEWCFYCTNAKNFMEDKHLENKYFDLGNKEEAREKIKELAGISNAQKTIPIIFYQGEHIGGYRDMLKKFIQIEKEESESD